MQTRPLRMQIRSELSRTGPLVVVVVVSGGRLGGQMTITVNIWLEKSGIHMVDLCPIVI